MATANLERRRKAIELELGRLGPLHPWAGTYLYGDGLATNVSLSLAPDAGFVFEWYGCTGLYDRNWGSIEAGDGRIELNFTLPNLREDYQGLAETLVPVLWGKRRYLVAPEQMDRFCNLINTGWEPRHGMHGYILMREGDGNELPTGHPDLPPEHASKLLDSPLRAQVVEVGDSEHNEGLIRTRIRMDAGAEQGAWVGMRLYSADRERGGDIHLVEVHSNSAIAEMVSAPGRGPVVGMGLVSRSPMKDR